jgi:alpha-glucan,water dikinase
VDRIDGIEDIPGWVSAVITPDEVDILSHIAIRSRNSRVMLATCYDRDLLEKMKAYKGAHLSVVVDNNVLRYEETEEVASRKSVNSKKRNSGETGASKSRNLKTLADRLPEHIKLPASAVLQPDMFEETLKGSPGVMAKLKTMESELTSQRGDYSSILARMRETIINLPMPDHIADMIQKTLINGRIISGWSESSGDAICLNVKKVWASIWNERAYLSRVRRGISGDQVSMGVLIQKVIPADYAFIVHTCNPISDDRSEILTEVVVGLGESLAGNSPGSPLSVISKKGGSTHTIVSYPSKPAAIFDTRKNGSLIIRSDSSDEDLQDFAGAGLYDSFFINSPSMVSVAYDREKLFWDQTFQRELCSSIAGIAVEIEHIMGSPQDIEGVLSDSTFYVVQTRNQAG